MEWSPPLIIIIRSIVVILGVISLLALANAKAKRGATWNNKLKDIWWCHFILVYLVVQGHVELAFRLVPPTFAAFGCMFVFAWTIKACRNNTTYTLPKA